MQQRQFLARPEESHDRKNVLLNCILVHLCGYPPRAKVTSKPDECFLCLFESKPERIRCGRKFKERCFRSASYPRGNARCADLNRTSAPRVRSLITSTSGIMGTTCMRTGSAWRKFRIVGIRQTSQHFARPLPGRTLCHPRGKPGVASG